LDESGQTKNVLNHSAKVGSGHYRENKVRSDCAKSAFKKGPPRRLHLALTKDTAFEYSEVANVNFTRYKIPDEGVTRVVVDVEGGFQVLTSSGAFVLVHAKPLILCDQTEVTGWG